MLFANRKIAFKILLKTITKLLLFILVSAVILTGILYLFKIFLYKSLLVPLLTIIAISAYVISLNLLVFLSITWYLFSILFFISLAIKVISNSLTLLSVS